MAANDDLYAGLVRMGLIRPGERPVLRPLAGGVSSDVVRVDIDDRAICIKRALPRLKVAARWEVSVERNAAEVAWLRAAGAIAPEAAPRVIGEDRAAGLFAMDFLDPATYPVWKDRLRDGAIEPDVAAAVGERIVRIHAATANKPAVAAGFPNDATFHAIRLEPYLHATAAVHPDLGEVLLGIAWTTAATRLTLIHGDVSPKNILVGPLGPVFLDAECATFGDPAFDLAFCLNHLLLKCIWRPSHAAQYLDCFERLACAYLGGVAWEPLAALDARAAKLLPGLMLARIDGKSPVEYITAEADKAQVRTFARGCLRRPQARVMDVARTWRGAVGS